MATLIAMLLDPVLAVPAIIAGLWITRHAALLLTLGAVAVLATVVMESLLVLHTPIVVVMVKVSMRFMVTCIYAYLARAIRAWRMRRKERAKESYSRALPRY